MTAANRTRVAGLDGCRHGWVLVTTSAEIGGTTTVERISDLRPTADRLQEGELAAAAIDIPIGLPAVGSRSCDLRARKLLGSRRSSVFPAPVRSALRGLTYEEASSISRRVSGKGVSRQVFAILPKIREVDDLMTPRLQIRLVEVHPEVSFGVLAGAPMRYHKSRPEGRAERLRVLRPHFPDIDSLAAAPIPQTSPDDVLDALVAACSARRYLARQHVQLGGERDEKGLRMEVIA